MGGFLQSFASGSYAPHGYCLLWQPALVWTHVIADALIAAAYFSIPLALVSLVRKRRDLGFGWMLGLFATFILACGSTHLIAIWNLWHGDYGLEAVVKAITAAASVPTAIILWTLIPKALAIPSPDQLQAANAELAAAVGERDAALARLTDESAQRKAAEQALLQRQKMDAVGQLTGGIAHDFNNLFQAIGGNLDLIKQRPDDPERVARWATNGIKGLDRGIRLTSQLLAFSRTQRLQLAAVDVQALLEENAALIRRSIGPTVELRQDVEDACMVQADATQLELAILNIAINARDAMPDGGHLSIATRSVAVIAGDGELEPGDYCEIAIGDTGLGMTPDVALRAVEPFFSTKTIGQGTGLGLSMAFGMARQSGGTIRIASAPGEGTTVSILMRVAAAEKSSAGRHGTRDGMAGERGEELPLARRADLEVMIVDDDDDVRDVIADTLETLGYRSIRYASGREALLALETRQPDLLVLDFAMPDLNGAEVARRARAVRPGINIMFVTGFADSLALDEAMDAHSLVLRKPFHAADLARLVDVKMDA